MKNKKVIVVAVIILIILAIVIGILRAKFNENYLYDLNGRIVKGISHEEFLEIIRNIEDEEQRKMAINVFLEAKQITEEEAESLR